MRLSRRLLLAALVAGAGCKPTPPTDGTTTTYSVQVKTTPPSSATVGTTVTVGVTTLGNNAVIAGQLVTFTVTAGGGSVSPASVTSGSDGSATTTWTLGTTAGTQTVHVAIAKGSSLDFSVNGTAVVPNVLSVLTQPSTTAQNGIPFFAQPVVQLKDGSGNTLHTAGISVTASGPALAVATGSQATLTAVTDANGQATFHDLTATAAGSQTITFSAPSITSATSNAVAVSSTVATAIGNGLAAAPLTAASNTQTYYSFTVPAGTTSIDFSTYGSTGNVELYARNGSYPTSSDFGCHANVAGPGQVCSVTSNLTGTWYLAVSAASAIVGSRVVAYAYNSSCTVTPITLGTTFTGTVTSTSCNVEYGGGLIENKYTFTTTTNQIVTFASSNSGQYQFLLYPTLRGSRFGTLSGTTGPFAITNTYILGPGTYSLAILNQQAGTPIPSETYSVTSTITPSEPASCKYLYGQPIAATVPLTLRSTDCAGTTAQTVSHRIPIFLGAGQTLTATMSSTAFDPFLKLYSGASLTSSGATLLTTDDNSGGGTTARVTYTNPATDGGAVNFMLETTSAVAGGLGAYTLTYTVSPNFPNVVKP